MLYGILFEGISGALGSIIIVQIIQNTLGDIVRKVASFWPADLPNLAAGQKHCCPHKFFQNIFDVPCFWHSLKDFKVGAAHARGEIGN